MDKKQVDDTVRYLDDRLPFQITINDLSEFLYIDWNGLMLDLVGLTFDVIFAEDQSNLTGGEHNVALRFHDNINNQNWWVGIEFVTLIGVALPEKERSTRPKAPSRSW